METEEKKILQWHPAFFASLQIELKKEAEYLSFESEHQLGTKPKEIDVLVIKKDPNVSIRKNIGRMFKTHNIIEYKSPEDYLSIDDFYKVYGYACFYKADTAHVDEIKANEITVSYVSKVYPYKVIKHLKQELFLEVKEIEPGIHYAYGMCFPIQFIITSRLTEKENLWLYYLTDDLTSPKQAEKILKEYEAHHDENLYQSMMNIIIDANENVFKEGQNMCEALLRISRENLKSEFEERETKGREIGKEETLLSLVHDGVLSASEAMKRLSISEEELVEKMNKMYAVCEV